MTPRRLHDAQGRTEECAAGDASPLASPVEWRIHLGAHKTATTHLQDTLAQRRDALLGRGVDFLPMRDVRALRLPPSSGRFHWRRLLGWPMRQRIEAAVTPIRKGPRRIAISEENLIGYVRDLMTPRLYPQLEQNLRPFAALSGFADMTLFLAIRSFDTLLPSAYAQQLRVRHVPGQFETLRQQALDNPPSWLDVVERISAVLPAARIRIWKYEDYRENEDQILSQFCGVEVPAGPRLRPPASTRALSAQSIAALEGLGQKMSNENCGKAASDLAEADEGDAPYRPFRPAEQAYLQEAYLADIEQIKHRFSDGIFVSLQHNTC